MTKYLDKKVKRNKSTKQNLGKKTKFRLAENKTKLTKIKRGECILIYTGAPIEGNNKQVVPFENIIINPVHMDEII